MVSWKDLESIRYFYSGALLIASLWQLEMVEVQRSWGFSMFVLPFGYQVVWWIARDLFYSFIMIAFILVLPFEKIRKKNIWVLKE